VRDLHDIAGAVQAQPGMKQQTFVAEPLLCLNDQGGERMDVTEDVASTLRAGMGGASSPCISAKLSERLGYPAKPCVHAGRVWTPTLAGADGGGGRNPGQCLVCGRRCPQG
jgi:DNA (cytosine-5)-methyltransferase 1